MGIFDLGWAAVATFFAVTRSLLVLGVRAQLAKPVPVTRELRCAPSSHQYLWMRNLSDYTATSFSSVSDRSAITPFLKTTPARTKATSCGALTAASGSGPTRSACRPWPVRPPVSPVPW